MDAEVQDDLYYTKEHEWVIIEDGVATIGISDYAQEALGDITFIELPGVDDEVEQFGEIASIESVKAANDIFSPVSGTVIEINESLSDNPGLINKSPYNKGWIAKIQVTDADELGNLMTADEYSSFLESVDRN
jgi:glycine cleavage system H protein